MHRRTLLAGSAATVLSACGFRPRGAPEFAFRSLYLGAPQASPLARELQRTLEGSGTELQVTRNPAQMLQTEAIFELLSERHERAVVAYNSSGQVRELQLRLYVRFSLIGKDGRVWIEEGEIEQTRDMTYSETLTLAKDEEEMELVRDMRQDVAQQLLRRLALVQPPVGA